MYPTPSASPDTAVLHIPPLPPVLQHPHNPALWGAHWGSPEAIAMAHHSHRGTLGFLNKTGYAYVPYAEVHRYVVSLKPPEWHWSHSRHYLKHCKEVHRLAKDPRVFDALLINAFELSPPEQLALAHLTNDERTALGFKPVHNAPTKQTLRDSTGLFVPMPGGPSSPDAFTPWNDRLFVTQADQDEILVKCRHNGPYQAADTTWYGLSSTPLYAFSVSIESFEDWERAAREAADLLSHAQTYNAAVYQDCLSPWTFKQYVYVIEAADGIKVIFPDDSTRDAVRRQSDAGAAAVSTSISGQSERSWSSSSNIPPSELFQTDHGIGTLAHSTTSRLSVVSLPDYDALTECERELCSVQRIKPHVYLDIKQRLFRSFHQICSFDDQGNTINAEVWTASKAQLVKGIDVNKLSKIYTWYKSLGLWERSWLST